MVYKSQHLYLTAVKENFLNSDFGNIKLVDMFLLSNCQISFKAKNKTEVVGL